MAAGASGKAPAAYRTIGEVARETGVAPHVLRYWETRFPELRPLIRAGQRRYYGPEHLALVRRIQTMLRRDGLTMQGAQRRLGAGGATLDLQSLRRLLSDALTEDAS